MNLCFICMQRQVEKIVETHGPRRSPRLSSRYMRSREVGEPGLTPFPLASVTYTATSRQSLGSYKVCIYRLTVSIGKCLDLSTIFDDFEGIGRANCGQHPG